MTFKRFITEQDNKLPIGTVLTKEDILNRFHFWSYVFCVNYDKGNLQEITSFFKANQNFKSEVYVFSSHNQAEIKFGEKKIIQELALVKLTKRFSGEDKDKKSRDRVKKEIEEYLSKRSNIVSIEVKQMKDFIPNSVDPEKIVGAWATLNNGDRKFVYRFENETNNYANGKGYAMYKDRHNSLNGVMNVLKGWDEDTRLELHDKFYEILYTAESKTKSKKRLYHVIEVGEYNEFNEDSATAYKLMYKGDRYDLSPGTSKHFGNDFIDAI
jgi:hypothetical protein